MTAGDAWQPAQVPPPDNWTSRVRGRLSTVVPPGQVLPDRQPAYVSSWIYVFGVLTLAALVVVLVTGALLAVGGSSGGTPRASGCSSTRPTCGAWSSSSRSW